MYKKKFSFILIYAAVSVCSKSNDRVNKLVLRISHYHTNVVYLLSFFPNASLAATTAFSGNIIYFFCR